MSSMLAANRQEIESLLQDYGVTRTLVFGSFARGDATENSDLDLLVTYGPETNLFDVMSLQNKLEQLLHRNVDLVSEKYLSTRLARRIKSDLKPLASVCMTKHDDVFQ